jgi:molecular chaperone GrpE (heat shock protein)
VDERDPVAGEESGWATVLGELAGLRAQVSREQDRAAAREQIIDRLHAENQSLRAGERTLLLRPLLTDLQRLRHELMRQADRLPDQFTATQAAELLRSYAYNVELTLERGGIAVVTPEPGIVFDPSLHRAVAPVPADDPGLNGRVAEVALDGYRDVESGRVVTPAEVRVHRWVPADPPAPPDAGPESADPIETEIETAETETANSPN